MFNICIAKAADVSISLLVHFIRKQLNKSMIQDLNDISFAHSIQMLYLHAASSANITRSCAVALRCQKVFFFVFIRLLC